MIGITNKILQKYADCIKQDYANFWSNNGTRELTENQQKMFDSFNIEFEVGSSYIRVVSVNQASRSSHSFIVLKPSEKFSLGTILKSASWKSPAKNFSRGDVLTGDFKRVRWTGVV